MSTASEKSENVTFALLQLVFEKLQPSKLPGENKNEKMYCTVLHFEICSRCLIFLGIVCDEFKNELRFYLSPVRFSSREEDNEI